MGPPGPPSAVDILAMCGRIRIRKGTACHYEPGDYVKVDFPDQATGIGEWMWCAAT
jgi:hypothetical protein